MSVDHMHARCLQKPLEGMNPLELGSQMVTSYHIGAENQIQILWKSIWCY